VCLLDGNNINLMFTSRRYAFDVEVADFHPFSSRVAALVVGIDNDREGQRPGYQQGKIR
jgi:hypothetical protein